MAKQNRLSKRTKREINPRLANSMSAWQADTRFSQRLWRRFANLPGVKLRKVLHWSNKGITWLNNWLPLLQHAQRWQSNRGKSIYDVYGPLQFIWRANYQAFQDRYPYEDTQVPIYRNMAIAQMNARIEDDEIHHFGDPSVFFSPSLSKTGAKIRNATINRFTRQNPVTRSYLGSSGTPIYSPGGRIQSIHIPISKRQTPGPVGAASYSSLSNIRAKKPLNQTKDRQPANILGIASERQIQTQDHTGDIYSKGDVQARQVVPPLVSKLKPDVTELRELAHRNPGSMMPGERSIPPQAQARLVSKQKTGFRGIKVSPAAGLENSRRSDPFLPDLQLRELSHRNPGSMMPGGRSIPPQVQARLEHFMGSKSPTAIVHTDSLASDLTRRHRAAALTIGHHIFFAPGLDNFDTPRGLALLGHELTHVVQRPPKRIPSAERLQMDEQEAQAVEQKLLYRTASALGDDSISFNRRSTSDSSAIIRQVPQARLASESTSYSAPPSTSTEKSFSGGDQNNKEYEKKLDLDDLTDEIYRRLYYRLTLEKEWRGV